MQFLTVLGFFLISLPIASQVPTGIELLDKAIAYHDPNSNWEKFDGTFTVTMESPKRATRTSKISLDLPQSFFKMTVLMDENQWSTTLNNEDCELQFNNSDVIPPEIKEKYRLNCDTARMYRNYYTYLYGLPMKLKDKGTLIDQTVTEKTIEKNTYWVLKVTYDPDVGSDTWYFYFDQNTFAMKRYQFFHDETKNDGEYIVLEDELELSGMRIPKNRSWYYNTDETYLGTDILTN